MQSQLIYFSFRILEGILPFYIVLSIYSQKQPRRNKRETEVRGLVEIFIVKYKAAKHFKLQFVYLVTVILLLHVLAQ